MPLNRLKPRKGSLTLYLGLLCAIMLTMASLKKCSSERLPERVDSVAGGDTLNVAIELSPMGVTLRGDSLSGPYYDMIRKACATLHRPVKFHPFTRISDALDWLEHGRCRLVVADIPVTSDLKEKYIFIDPGMVDRLVLVQQRDSTGGIGILTQTDLARKTVWIPRGSGAAVRIHNLAHEIGDTIIVKEDPDYGAEELGVLASLGQLPGGLAVVSRTVADTLIRRYPRQLDASVEISFNQYRGWAMMPRDSLLLDSITSALPR